MRRRDQGFEDQFCHWVPKMIDEKTAYDSKNNQDNPRRIKLMADAVQLFALTVDLFDKLVNTSRQLPNCPLKFHHRLQGEAMFFSSESWCCLAKSSRGYIGWRGWFFFGHYGLGGFGGGGVGGSFNFAATHSQILVAALP